MIGSSFPDKIKFRLDSPTKDYSVKTASYSQDPAKNDLKIGNYQELVITLDVTAAADSGSDATYDVYITMGDGLSKWDIVHFPQISNTAKRYTARVLSERQAEVTTAPPGIAAEPSAILETETAGSAQGIKTLGAGKVRNGPFADYIGHEVVIAGTLPSLTYAITVTGNHN
jgi:hypothetical protein